MIEWIDTTIYRRGDNERVPRVWRLKSRALSLIVHRHISYGNDAWLITCDPLFDNHKLPTTDEEQAKAMSITLVRKRLNECLAELD